MEDNLSLLFQSSFCFITRAQYDVKWIRPEIDKVLKKLEDRGDMCPDEAGTYGTAICLTHEFTKTRKYSSKKKELNAGDTETFSRRVYLHVYFNDVIRIKKNRAFGNMLNALRNAYQEGQREFKPAAQGMIEQFMNIKEKRNGDIEITFKTKAMRAAQKYDGVFVLVANKEKNPFEALKKFRKREWIEDFFEEFKQRIGGKRFRVWDDLTLDGKKLVQFVVLCYYEYFSGEINWMKATLGIPNGEHDHDLKVDLDKECF